MSDLVSPPLKTDLIGGRRNNSRYKAVSVISANRDFHAGHVDLLSDHVRELLGTASLFHHVISPSEKMPRLAQRFDETGHSWVWGHRTPAARSLQIRGELKADEKQTPAGDPHRRGHASR